MRSMWPAMKHCNPQRMSRPKMRLYDEGQSTMRKRAVMEERRGVVPTDTVRRSEPNGCTVSPEKLTSGSWLLYSLVRSRRSP